MLLPARRCNTWTCNTTTSVTLEQRPIMQDTSISVLNLSCNQIGPGGVAFLAKALKQNKTLTELHLAWNELGPEGAHDFAKVIETNHSLVTLNLGFNEIGPDGTKRISKALARRRCCVTDLNLSWNSLGVKGSSSVAAVLKMNSSIQVLDLSCNAILDTGAMHLYQQPWRVIVKGTILSISMPQSL